MIHQNKTKKSRFLQKSAFFHDRLLLQTPFNPVLGVFDIKTERGEFVADQVRRCPILLSLRILSYLHKQIDSPFVGFGGGSVIILRTYLHTENLDKEHVEEMP